MIKTSERLALEAIIQERIRQVGKWGEQNHDDERWLAILIEEVGEVAQEMLADGGSLRDEVVQVAAVAVAWIEAIGRRPTVVGD